MIHLFGIQIVGVHVMVTDGSVLFGTAKTTSHRSTSPSTLDANTCALASSLDARMPCPIWGVHRKSSDEVGILDAHPLDRFTIVDSGVLQVQAISGCATADETLDTLAAHHQRVSDSAF
jgi:hypothetical protein